MACAYRNGTTLSEGMREKVVEKTFDIDRFELRSPEIWVILDTSAICSRIIPLLINEIIQGPKLFGCIDGPKILDKNPPENHPNNIPYSHLSVTIVGVAGGST